MSDTKRAAEDPRRGRVAGDPLRPSDSAVGGDASGRLHRPASGVPGPADPGSAVDGAKRGAQRSKAPGPVVDPELEDDLGAELGFRGDSLEAELEAARAEAAANLDVAQRVQAEFDNYRKRIQRDQGDAIKRAGQRMVEELLPILDNMERAIDHAAAAGETGELLKGLEMVHNQVLDVFAKEGVSVDDPQGAAFDPELHQAVGQHEDPKVPENTVVEVYQKGYVMNGRVVRPAMVTVSTGGPTRAEE